MEAASTVPAASETLRFAGAAELERLRTLDVDPVTRTRILADVCRINALSMIADAGSGHIGTSFSVLDVATWLLLEVCGDDDVCFSSKGHDAPALYSALVAAGRLDASLLRQLRRHGGLPGHPDIAATPQLHTNTGSLGMGIAKAKGLIRAARAEGRRRRAFVILGDGELQEGQIWESLATAARDGLGELCAVVDHNRLQSDTWVDQVSDLGDLDAKFRAFGWAVARCDGNDVGAVASALDGLLTAAPDTPKVLVAETVKGHGAVVFEPHDLPRLGTARYAHHSGAPDAGTYAAALAEIVARVDERLAGLGAGALRLDEVERRPPPPAPSATDDAPVRLIDAYGAALAHAAAADPRVVALSADLAIDTGLVALRAATPEQFLECGIAEQDMVSQAGGLALGGRLPVVHSFACFLTTRANEQIFNNATERTRVVYAGSLAGIVPGGPGHSHQSVRDIALMGCVPGMALLEPTTEEETAAALRWALTDAGGPVYLRLVSVPWPLGFPRPASAPLVAGRGTVVRDDGDVVLVTTGPVLASQAWAAADLVGGAALVLLPWLRDVDGAWLAGVAGDRPILVLDNHVLDGGQGVAVRAALPDRPIDVHGVVGVPAGGTNTEVLAVHGLDAAGIAARIEALR